MSTFPLVTLESAMTRRRQALPRLLRPFTQDHKALPRACLVTGPRGVGKTTFLLHHSQGKKFLYFSADNPLLAGLSLYEIVQNILAQGYEGVIIDEVHFARDWSLHLKALYDDYPQHSFWVSDSSSLVLRSGTGDLSRRFVPVLVPLLSFREFVFLETGNTYPIFDPFEGVPFSVTPELLSLFRAYRKFGTRPFYAEGNFAERMTGVLEKTLHSDVPFFLPQITDGNFRLMNAIIGTLARSTIPRLQVRSLCADWNIGAEKLYQLLFVMESVGVVRIIRKAKETKANTVGEKIFFGDPVLYDIFEGNLGTAREALVVSLLTEGGELVEASPEETHGDFLVRGEILIEVGGASKKPKAADFVLRDDLDVPAGKALPLWTLGFRY